MGGCHGGPAALSPHAAALAAAAMLVLGPSGANALSGRLGKSWDDVEVRGGGRQLCACCAAHVPSHYGLCAVQTVI